jgi:hypothetical protein
MPPVGGSLREAARRCGCIDLIGSVSLLSFSFGEIAVTES